MKKKFKKKVRVAVKNTFFKTVAKVLYLAGFTSLIPFFPLIFSPDLFILKAIKSSTLIVGILLIIASTSLILHLYPRRRALQVLGMFTIIPSFIALFYAIVGPELVNELIVYSGPAQDVILRWISFNMPRAITTAATYFLIGFALLLSSYLWPKESRS